LPGAEALSGEFFLVLDEILENQKVLVLVRDRHREINHRQKHENKSLDD
jgi:hypothetical protein